MLRALPALRERRPEFRRGGQRGRDAGHHLARDPGGLERRDLLLRAPEQHRIAALQADHDRVLARGVDQALVDELLRRRVLAATLAHRDLLRAFGEGDGIRVDERIEEDDVGGGEQARRPQRQEVGRARAGTDEVDRTRCGTRGGQGGTRRTHAHRISPAATVALVASSIRMKLPVAWLSA